MKAGSIWECRHFICKDGSELEKKYLLILNTPIKNEIPYCVCLATSKGDRKPQKYGCHPEKGYFKINGGQEWFPLDTWLVLNRIYEKNFSYFLKKRLEEKDLERKSDLALPTIKSIIKCIQQCKDVSQFQKDIIRECAVKDECLK